MQQIASFVEFFIWLLVLKTFFLPLFIIPTGSMAETLFGAHGMYTCPNCGYEYPIGFDRAPDRPSEDPDRVQCPNCRWAQQYSSVKNHLRAAPGDRIVVHGWPYELGGAFGPRTWDVVVFRNPAMPEENYIKRLIGLPGQKIELINGDLFINDEIARKPHRVQDTMWFNCYDHDYAPRRPSPSSAPRGEQAPFVGYSYRPHWQLVAGAGWDALESRSPRFEASGDGSGTIRLLTHDGTPQPVCDVIDEYGYNWRPRHPVGNPYNVVSDLRLSADVRIASGDGYVELSTMKYRAQYYARLYASGRITIERDDPARGRQLLAEGKVAPPRGAVNFALSVVDFSATAEIDGAPVVAWNEDITRGRAIELGRTEQGNRESLALAQRVLITASRVSVTLGHLRLQRDIYYTGYAADRDGPLMKRAVQGQPFQLGAGEYFVLGDNSPASLDGRFWHEAAGFLKNTDYRLGTVPESQLIGRAFFVYWPGFLPLWEGGPLFRIGSFDVGPNLLPNFGQIRWIH